MIIKSITLNNYRLYKGENTLSLSSSDEKNIVLISGENGLVRPHSYTLDLVLIW